MYNLTREDIDLEAIRARIAQMTDAELVKYGQSAAWMAEHNDRATWRVQLEEAGAECPTRTELEAIPMNPQGPGAPYLPSNGLAFERLFWGNLTAFVYRGNRLIDVLIGLDHLVGVGKNAGQYTGSNHG